MPDDFEIVYSHLCLHPDSLSFPLPPIISLKTLFLTKEVSEVESPYHDHSRSINLVEEYPEAQINWEQSIGPTL